MTAEVGPLHVSVAAATHDLDLGALRVEGEQARVRRPSVGIDGRPGLGGHVERPELRVGPGREGAVRGVERGGVQQQLAARRVEDHRQPHHVEQRLAAGWGQGRHRLVPGIGREVVDPGVVLRVRRVRVGRAGVGDVLPIERPAAAEHHHPAVHRVGGDGMPRAASQRGRQRSPRQRVVGCGLYRPSALGPRYTTKSDEGS